MQPAVTGLVVGDAPAVWESLGFVVEDGACTVGALRIVLTGGGGGVLGWCLDAATVSGDVDGLPTRQAPSPPAGPEHPNGIVDVDHVVIRAGDHARAVDALVAAGFELRRTREALQPDGSAMRQAFFRPPGTIVEVVGAATGGPAAPSTFYGIALTAPDLDGTAAFLADRAKPPTAAVQPGRRITTLTPAAGPSVRIAVMSPHVRTHVTEPTS